MPRQKSYPTVDIDLQDLKDIPGAVKMATIVNDHMRSVNSLLSGGITLGNNCAVKIFDVPLTVPPEGVNYNPYPISLLWDLQGSTPIGCIIIHARTADGTVGILGSPFPDVTFVGNRVIINSVVAQLTKGKDYLFRFMVIGG